MNRKTQLTATSALVTLLFGASAASAAPLNLIAGDYDLKFEGYQQLSPEGAITYEHPDRGETPTGESAWGVVRGTSYSVDGTDEWGARDEQGGIYGMFHGFTPVEDPTEDRFQSTGGQLDLYYFSDISGTSFSDLFGEDFGPDLRDGDDSFGDITSGERLVSIEFKPGAVTDDDDVTLDGDLIPDPGGTFTGFSLGFGDVIDDSGIWADQVVRDTFERGDHLRDVRFDSRYNDESSWDGDGDVIGADLDDPASFTAIPNPGTLMLMGLGLLGLGGVAGAARRNRESA